MAIVYAQNEGPRIGPNFGLSFGPKFFKSIELPPWTSVSGSSEGEVRDAKLLQLTDPELKGVGGQRSMTKWTRESLKRP